MNEVWVIIRLFINDDGYEAEELYSICETEDLAKKEMDRLNALPESIANDDWFTFKKQR